jgi:hypothetical protein
MIVVDGVSDIGDRRIFNSRQKMHCRAGGKHCRGGSFFGGSSGPHRAKSFSCNISTPGTLLPTGAGMNTQAPVPAAAATASR